MTGIFAHRGASKAYPENTQRAFDAALPYAQGLEIDVQRTRDGHLVVLHDEEIDRTSNGQGWVKDMDLAQLRTYTFHGGKEAFFNQDCPLPLLEEVLAWVKKTDLLINIELKTSILPYTGMVEAVLDQIRALALEDQVILSSFNHRDMVLAKKLAPQVAAAFLTASNLVDPAAYCQAYGMDYYHPLFTTITKEDVHRLHDLGIGVNVWTVDEPLHIQACLEMGVDHIITNCPKEARDLIKK
ncbi:MAG: glycerophosphodiester phosphodiesterase [Tissierellia bacterium]|nr:glycerophosphodiester phosphodiesterase [Tissierellia bacterium]